MSVVSRINVINVVIIFFCTGQINFCSVYADTKMSMHRFPNDLQNMWHKQFGMS